jgi:Helix-turn-helix domain
VSDMLPRRYTFMLYPTVEQDAALRKQARMVAELWNALLERWETIYRRTVQRQEWVDASGAEHVGTTIHCQTWQSQRYASGERVTVQPGQNGRPKPYTKYDMQNEVTYLCNEMPEWRESSVWIGHRTAALLALAIEAFYRPAHALAIPAKSASSAAQSNPAGDRPRLSSQLRLTVATICSA